MRRHLGLVLGLGALACACGGDDASTPDAAPGAALVLPAVIDLPYVAAGEGAVTVDVAVDNPGELDAAATGWALDGDPALTLEAAPAVVLAHGHATISLRFAGADIERIAGATLHVDGPDGAHVAEVWAVAGDPALADADLASVTGAGDIVIGDSAIIHMPAAPFPTPGGAWTDDRVHVFVPADWRERAAQDVVLHFHGHSTTIDLTVLEHHYREQVYASGVDAILVVPQGPVNAASGDFGKLMQPAGTRALLDEVLIALYRAGVVTRPALGDVILTSHSGGYQAVARNLDPAAPFTVRQVDLFDSLYGYVATYQDFVERGGLLRSDYTCCGGTDVNNQNLAMTLAGLGITVADAPDRGALRDARAVIYYTAASHTGSTRDEAAYTEALRWGARHGRRGGRAELRSAVATGGMATVHWLAPRDDDTAGFVVQLSTDGTSWRDAVEVAPDVAEAQLALGDARAVRVVPRVDDVAVVGQPTNSFAVSDAADVLVVDGFDRVLDGGYGGLANDFAARIGAAAGGAHTASHRAITEDGFDLAPYRLVIWLCGDDSNADHPLTPDERAVLDAYLAGGGHLIISGSELGYDLVDEPGGPGWLSAAAGASYAADDADTTTAAGAGPLAGVASFAFGDANAAYLEDYPDVYAAGGGAQELVRYSTGGAAAVGLAGRAAVVGFPLETIVDDAALGAVVTGLRAFVAP